MILILKVRLLILLVLLFSCAKESNIGGTNKSISVNKIIPLNSFESVGKSSIHQNKYNLTIDLKESKEFDVDTYAVDSSAYQIITNQNDTIHFIMYEVLDEGGPLYDNYSKSRSKLVCNLKSYVEIHNKTYYMSEMITRLDYQNKLPPFNFTIGYNKALQFELNNIQYIIFHLTHDLSGMTSHPEGKFIVLYKISEYYEVAFMPLPLHEYSSLNVFNDFNSDGLLDYAVVENTIDRGNVITPYTLVEGVFMPLRNYYILLDKEGENIICDSINWFYPIKDCE